MSLPPSYALLLNELNRDITVVQPIDVLQYCSNWFNHKLAAERSQTRTTSPASTTMTSTAFSQGYTFGGNVHPAAASSSATAPMDLEPTSFSSMTPTPSSPFTGRASRTDQGGSSRAAMHREGGGASGAGASSAQEMGEDSDTDSNDHPSTSTNPASLATTIDGIPTSYNLGRRTSVSAESLSPNTSSSPLPKTVIVKTASQRARIEASIVSNLLFRNLDRDQYDDVVNAMKEVAVLARTEVIVQGAVGDYFYVVEEGAFEVWVRPTPTHTYVGPGQSTTTTTSNDGEGSESKRVATYGPGGSFGELALMYNAPRAATVIATTNATLWALDRVTFRSILMEHTARKRRMYETFLGDVPLLESLEPRERAKIADALEERVYDEGSDVVVEGEKGKNFFLVESGQAEVVRKYKNGDRMGEEEKLKTLSRGDYFGELALLNSAPRAATVRAMPGHGKLRVATLGEKAFTRLLGPVTDILRRKAGSYELQTEVASSVA